jgi:beta-lactam-binding protein with PASTA domain
VIAAQRSDLLLALSGSGLVRTQQPEAGAVVAAGSTVSIALAPPELAPRAPPSSAPGSERSETQSNKTTAQLPPPDRANDDDIDVQSSPPMLAVKQAGGPDG